MRRLILGHLLDFVYLAAVVLALPWIVWRMTFHGKYREGYTQKLFGCVPRRTGDEPCVWLHAVSVGEVNVLRTLVERLERQWPGVRFYISSTTKTGCDLARQRFARHTVFYCPLDFTWAVGRAAKRIRPDLLILAELELWPNLIFAARRHGARIAVINGRLSDRSFRGYRRLRWLIGPVLGDINMIAAQDNTTADRFAELANGVGRLVAWRMEQGHFPRPLDGREKKTPAPSPLIQVTGSLKYDGAETDRGNAATQRLRTLADIRPDDVVLLAGSTQAPEEELALRAYRSLVGEFPQLRLILVPRHPQRFGEVAELLNGSEMSWVRRTELERTESGRFFRGSPREPSGTSRAALRRSSMKRNAAAMKDSRPLLLVDTVGELGAWWGTADIAFVGGSFGARGGQNMIEPAAYGAAVCFGPNTRNFRDIVSALLQANAARVVGDGHELTAFVRRCLTDRRWAAELGQRARRLVLSQLGATERTVDLLQPLLPLQGGGPGGASRPAA